MKRKGIHKDVGMWAILSRLAFLDGQSLKASALSQGKQENRISSQGFSLGRIPEVGLWFPGECGIAILSPSSFYLMMLSSAGSLGCRTSALLAWTAPRPAKLWAPGLPQEPSRILARDLRFSGIV